MNTDRMQHDEHLLNANLLVMEDWEESEEKQMNVMVKEKKKLLFIF